MKFVEEIRKRPGGNMERILALHFFLQPDSLVSTWFQYVCVLKGSFRKRSCEGRIPFSGTISRNKQFLCFSCPTSTRLRKSCTESSQNHLPA